jgi:hypothetical protein
MDRASINEAFECVCNNLLERGAEDRERVWWWCERRGNPNDGFAFNWLSWLVAVHLHCIFNCLSVSMASTGFQLAIMELDQCSSMVAVRIGPRARRLHSFFLF